MNQCNIIVFDFETGGLDPKTCVPIQVAAMVIHPRMLEPIPGAVFNHMMCPPTQEEFDSIQDGALAKNKKTREEIKKAAPEKLVWQEFTDFVTRYKTKDGLPIAAGQNIVGYDLIISERLCKKYGPWNKKKNQQELWNRQILELMCYTFGWFENSVEPDSYSMDTLRKFFGISEEGAHDALKDVKDTWLILSKFLKLQRNLEKRIHFKDALKP
jgi:DNA polymerase III epsilon subunit-like protein